MAPMVGVGSNTAGHLPQVIASHDGVGIGAAYAAGRFERYPAGTHMTQPAANTVFAKGALIALSIHPVETGVYPFK